MNTHFFTAVRDDCETEITVEFAIRGGCEAQVYGPAENCYPAEAPEIQIVACWLLAEENDPHAVSINLTDSEVDRICIEILESPWASLDENHNYDRD